MTLKSALVAVDSPSMPSRMPKLADESGFTLVELLVAAVVLVIGMAGAFTLLSGADKTTVTNNARMGATNLSREILEDARSVDYDTLTPTGIEAALKAKMGTPTAPSPWKVQRRGIGRRLLAALRRAAHGVGIGTVFVPVDDEDTEAVAFYSAVGGTPRPVTFFEFDDSADT